ADARGAPVGQRERGEDPDGRGFAGAVGPEEPEDLTLRHREVDLVQRDPPAEALVETLDRDHGLSRSETWAWPIEVSRTRSRTAPCAVAPGSSAAPGVGGGRHARRVQS